MIFFVSAGFYLVSAFAFLLDRFFSVVAAGRYRSICLVAINMVFVYLLGKNSIRYALVTVIVSVLFYLAVKLVGRRRKRLFGILVVVMFLLFFAVKMQPGTSDDVFSSIVPVFGFSFFFLRIVHFAFDYSSGKIKVAGFLQFMGFITFFPVFASGPVMRFQQYCVNHLSPVPLTRDACISAGNRILMGLIKKGIFAALLYDHSLAALSMDSAGVLDVICRSLVYSFVIYFDFSGYSDMAIGLSRLFGFVVPENFDYPYLKRNLIDFWNAWHMTFSFWLRDYIFMPIGQRLFRTRLKKKPLVIAVISYVLTFLFCGFWHGKGINFILWGLYHGLGLCGVKVLQESIRRTSFVALRDVLSSKPAGFLCVLITFLYVSFGWVFFVLDSRRLYVIFSKLL
ncbi:MAG: hypothetical protein A2583_05610 [Bdellovibrionales bacterium RIFOXYD1_FULL_53_11]|nr:MAG: hypothetical protein A2583_05610 [Bdellovibrionales bacterium RIFOXYD1_FULL_53_11]